MFSENVRAFLSTNQDVEEEMEDIVTSILKMPLSGPKRLFRLNGGNSFEGSVESINGDEILIKDKLGNSLKISILDITSIAQVKRKSECLKKTGGIQ